MNAFSSKRGLLITFSVLILLGIGGVLATLMLSGHQNQVSAGKPLIGGPFELIDHRGETVTEATYAGRYMLVYFGYSYCPDFCPMSLQTMTAAYDLLSAEEQAKVEPIFITVDPERDTVAAIADYVSLFHEDLIGLTGSVDQVNGASKAYRVYHAKAVDSASSAEYLVDHSSFYYLMGPDGDYVQHFGHDTVEEDMATRLREIIG
ncbi:MAG: SCO family protein [Pseudomonadota bacterium]